MGPPRADGGRTCRATWPRREARRRASVGGWSEWTGGEEKDTEVSRQQDAVGRRPSWPLGGGTAGAAFAAAAEIMQTEIDPTENVNASIGYQRHLAGVLTRRALGQALVRAMSA